LPRKLSKTFLVNAFLLFVFQRKNYILKNVKHIRRTLCYTRTQEQSNKPIKYLIYGALLLLLFGCSDSYTPLQKPAVYIDPSLPDSMIPYFATVPVDYVFGPTKYEIIKELFLVEPDECDNEGCEEEQSDSLSFEKAFYNSSSMNDLKSYLKKNYPSGKDNRKYSSEQLDQLFNYWINL